MKRIIIIAGIIITVLMLLILTLSGIFINTNWESTAEFGSWAQEIFVNYEDGTSEPLKRILEKPLSTLTYDNKAMTGFTYVLKAKADSTDYTSADIKINLLQLEVVIKLGATTKATRLLSWSHETYNIPVDSTFHNVDGSQGIDLKSILDSGAYTAGTYTISFSPIGGIDYRGSPDGEWFPATLPGGTSVNVIYTKGTLSLDLGFSYSW